MGYLTILEIGGMGGVSDMGEMGEESGMGGRLEWVRCG